MRREIMLKREEISTFEWKELHNKSVKVFVYEEAGFQISALYEPESQEFYIVSVKEKK